jgi:hypothetical protein
MAKQTRMDDAAILSVIQNELDQSIAFGSSTGFVSTTTTIDIETPLKYYLGLPDGNEVEGRSRIISTDVADAVEWLMPAIMDELTKTNEVVTFDPTCAGDENQAELESAYVYDVLMKKNPGFIIIHQMVKDALLQNNGIVKTYYEEYEEAEVERYTGVPEQVAQLLVADKSIEVLEKDLYMDESGMPYYNLKFKHTKTCGRVCVKSIPLESFRINADHNSIDPTTARFCSHEEIKTISDLRKEGVSEDIIKRLSPASSNMSSYRFEYQNEGSIMQHNVVDDSMTQVRVNESTLQIDIDGSGIAEWYLVKTAGEDTPSILLSAEPLTDGSPWGACTGILMSHKFRGLSIYDRLKQLQDQKTSLWRNILDNIYLQNNQEKEVVEGMVNIDDLLISRPGGIKRVKKPGMINPLQTSPLPNSIMDIARYMDEIKAGRVGVSADGASAPQNIGDRVGSQGVDRLMTSKEALAQLIVRVIAETGIKPLCVKIHDLLHKHFDTVEDYKFRGQWVQVDPKTWTKRPTSTVRVGVGSGNKDEKKAALGQVQQIQSLLKQSDLGWMVPDTKVFATINDMCKTYGLLGAEQYVLNPSTPEGMQAKQQAQQSAQQNQQLEMQAKASELQANADIAKSALQTSQAQMQNVQLKYEIEAAKHAALLEKQSYEAQIAGLKQRLEEVQMFVEGKKSDNELEFKYDELAQKTFISLETLNTQKELKKIDASMPKSEGSVQ